MSNMEEAIAALLRSQAALQESIKEMCSRTLGQQRRAQSPQRFLVKMTKDDDVTAYLELFERVAQREGWPPAEWANILAPYLTGEAQRVYQDMPPGEASSYGHLRTAILAQYGYSLPARAQHFHAWQYDPTQPARPQVAELSRRARRWLEEGEGPSATERVVVCGPYPPMP